MPTQISKFLFEVSNTRQSRSVRVWATNDRMALDQAAQAIKFRAGSKLAAKDVTGNIIRGEKVARATHANRGVEAAYRKALEVGRRPRRRVWRREGSQTPT